MLGCHLPRFVPVKARQPASVSYSIKLRTFSNGSNSGYLTMKGSNNSGAPLPLWFCGNIGSNGRFELWSSMGRTSVGVCVGCLVVYLVGAFVNWLVVCSVWVFVGCLVGSLVWAFVGCLVVCSAGVFVGCLVGCLVGNVGFLVGCLVGAFV
jgi:hypothetical protein